MSADTLRHAARLLVPFLAAFGAMLAVAWSSQELAFRGDAHETWEVARTLFGADDPYRSYVEYRGFVMFVLCAGIYEVSAWLGADDVATFRVFGALAFAALTTISLPTLFSRLLGTPPSMGRTLVFSGLALYFFHGYFLYPSSDYVAVYFLVLAMNRVLAPGGHPAAALGLAGLWMAAAIYTRSNFVVCLPLLVLLALLRLRDGAYTPRRFAAGMACFSAAVVLVVAMNHAFVEHRGRTAGPEQTQGWRVLNGQLTNGLKMQKIEWSVDDSYEGMVIFGEPAGKAVLEQEGITGWLKLPDYLALAARHPATFAGLYARHLFNGLDIAYPTVYVEDVRRDRFWFALANYSVLFVGLLVAATLVAGRRRSLAAALGFACLVGHALFCVPFPIEPRFFLGMLLGLHGLAVFGAGRLAASLPEGQRVRAAWLGGLLYLGFVAACFAASARTYGQIEGEPLPLRLPWAGDAAPAALP